MTDDKIALQELLEKSSDASLPLKTRRRLG
jgi:hypothetical protein